jgi:hypothetical protein
MEVVCFTVQVAPTANRLRTGHARWAHWPSWPDRDPNSISDKTLTNN